MSISECPKYTTSQYFRDLYSIPEDKRLSFGVEIDAMRIFMLLALESPLIYFDFDILPKNDTKLGEIQANQGFLVAENDGKGHDYKDITHIENAIIAVSDSGKIKMMEIYNEVKSRLKGYYPMLMRSPHYVYTIMESIINYTPSIDRTYGGNKKLYTHKMFGFQSNGGNVEIQHDNSWKKNKHELYSKEELAKIENDIKVVINIEELSVISSGQSR